MPGSSQGTSGGHRLLWVVLSSTSDVSELHYNHINDLVNNSEQTGDNKQNGWLYLSINPTNNKVCWEDYSYGSFNIAEAEAQEKAEAFIETWCNNFELENITLDNHDIQDLIWKGQYVSKDNVIPSCLFFGPRGYFELHFEYPILKWILKTNHEDHNDDPTWEQDYNYYIEACQLLNKIQKK